ncbi:MAG: class I SAM-dependent methyltransferase [Proteobacteria bacterium]|nr:class I SAM-dependent methyltransferase [Pseudomonadota bacterium]
MAPITKPDRAIPSTAQSSSCCSAFYEQDWVRHLAEDIFHPGGEELTNRTVAAMNLPAGAAIADLGCGTGTTAIMLARYYDFVVSAVDISAANIERAVQRMGADQTTVRFYQADAHQLPFNDSELDGLIAECSFSLFSERETVLAEIRRVLKPGGKLAITDMATSGALPEDIAGVLAPWTCLADAVDQETYLEMFAAAGFKIQTMADESAGLISLVRMLKRKLLLLGAGVLVNGKAPAFDLAGFDLASIKFWLDRFATEVEKGSIRYLRFNLYLPCPLANDKALQ